MPKSPEKQRSQSVEQPETVPSAPHPVKAKGKDGAKAKAPTQDGAGGRSAPETVNGNTRVNVAFPFSKIEVQEPSAELVDLAGVLLELITALEDWVPAAALRDIRSRAESLSARLAD